ncbi:MAG: PAS domain S-box protein [Pseudomonadota bacterium]
MAASLSVWSGGDISDAQQIALPLDQATNVQDTTPMGLLLQKRGLIALSLIVMLLLATSAVWLAKRIERDERKQITAFLSTQIDVTYQAFKSWANEFQAVAAAWATSPEVVQATRSLLAGPQTPSGLRKSPLQDRLRELLQPVYAQRNYQGYSIIGRDYRVIASLRNELIGETSILTQRPLFLADVFSGSAAVTLPMESEIELVDEDGELRRGISTMFVGAPIYDKGGGIIAALVFRLDPTQDFTELFERSRIGASGETYAFDNQALMISRTRFTPQLREMGLLAPGANSILNIRLLDPGINLTEAGHPPPPGGERPLTRMAQRAFEGGAGASWKSYRDYRGVPVVGAWLWDEALGLGIASEMEEAEIKAYVAPHNFAIMFTTIAAELMIVFLLWVFIKSRAQIAESKEKFSKVFHATPDPIIITSSRNGKILDVNEGFTRATGYDRAEVLGKTTAELDLWLDTAQRSALIDQILKNRRVTNVECAFRVKNGAVLTGLASAEIIDINHEMCFLAIVKDITERKRMEDALAKSEQDYRLVTENAPALIAYYGRDLRYRFVNRRYAEWFGVSAQQIIGMHVRDVIGAEAFENTRLQREWALAGQPVLFDAWSTVKGGHRRWVSIHYVPHIGEQGRVDGIYALITDVHERKMAENMTRELLAQNRDLTQRLFGIQERERRAIARELHDEFGQLLTAINLHAHTIAEHNHGIAPEIRDSAQVIVNCVSKMQKGVRTLIHRLRPSVMDDLGLGESVHELVTQWREQHPHIDCELVMGDDLDDLGEELNITLYRMIQEGLTNVAKHSGATEVTVCLNRADDGSRVELRIEDNGVGLMSGHSTGKGFGLPGMRERVLAAGGEFSYCNAQKGGFCVEAMLPCRVHNEAISI